MVKAKVSVNNFTRGQLDKRMRGRFDLDFYYAGVEKQLNFESDVQGSARYRIGTEFLGETKDNNKAYLYEFIFSESESYALEFTDQALRFWTPDGIVGGGTPTEIVTPYLEADLAGLQITQSADTMYIAHENYHPKQLIRTSANNFTFQDHTLLGTIPSGLDWTNSDNYPSAVTIYEKRLIYAGSNANPQTVYFSQSFLYDSFAQGVNDDDGMEYRIGSERVSRIKWLSSTDTQCVVGGSGNLSNIKSPSLSEPLTPTNVIIRTAGTTGVAPIRPAKRDNTIIYAQAGREIVNSYEFVLQTDGFNSVDRTILSSDITESGVSHMTFSNRNPNIIIAALNNGTCASLVWKPEQEVFAWNAKETDGLYVSFASLPQPIGSDRVIQSVTRTIDGSTKNYIEVWAKDYTIPDLENYFTGVDNQEIDEASFKIDLYEAQKDYIHADSVLTFNGLDRGLDANATLTLPVAAVGDSVQVTSDQNLFAASDVDGEIRYKDGEGWATITGFTSATEVTVTIDSKFRKIVDNAYVDVTSMAAGEYYITADQISGLGHLEGKEVVICGDGASLTRQTVSSGAITIDAQVSVGHIGLPYNGIIKTMNIEAGGTNGTAQASRKLIKNANILFLDTVGCSYGTNIYNLEDLAFQNTGNDSNRPPMPTSDFRQVSGFEDTQRDKRIVVLQTDPVPCIIQQIIPEVNTWNQ